MVEPREPSCGCGHDRTLHDNYGCAAFLGAFEDTAAFKRYCPCKQPGGVLLAVVHDADMRVPVVAEVRIRERGGAAIGICESPVALELGPSAELVLAAMKRRLRGAIEPLNGGVPQALRVIRASNYEKAVSIEWL
jgi:hypothetical protein